MIRVFNFKMNIADDEFANGAINIDQKVFDVASDGGWKSVFFDLHDDEGVVEYLLEMMVLNDFRLNEIECFYGLPNSLVTIIDNPSWKKSIWFEIEPASD